MQQPLSTVLSFVWLLVKIAAIVLATNEIGARFIYERF
jgi:hypothetical protein